MTIASSARVYEVFSTGIRNGIDLKISISIYPYVKKEIFYDYVTSVFIYYVNNQRSIEGFSDELAVLSMYNHSSHCDPEILKILAENRVIDITFPPHTYNLFQMLDLVIFGALKYVKRGLTSKKSLNDVAELAEKVSRAYEQVTTSINVRSSFERVGISSDLNEDIRRIIFDEEKVQNFKHIIRQFFYNTVRDIISYK